MNYRPAWATNKTKCQLFQEKCGQCGLQPPHTSPKPQNLYGDHSCWSRPSFFSLVPHLLPPLPLLSFLNSNPRDRAGPEPIEDTGPRQGKRRGKEVGWRAWKRGGAGTGQAEGRQRKERSRESYGACQVNEAEAEAVALCRLLTWHAWSPGFQTTRSPPHSDLIKFPRQCKEMEAGTRPERPDR